MTHHNQQTRELFWSEDLPQIRAAEGGKQYVYGYAALFGVRSRTLYTPKGQPFVEEILPGAFDLTDFSMLRCQFDHREFVAAPPTLTYMVDARGLYYEYEHDDLDEGHRKVLRRLLRREAKGSSFIFTVLPENIEVTKEGGVMVHRIRKAESVYDVGPVIAPAYPQTSAFVRAMDTETEPEMPGNEVETEPEMPGNEAEIEPETPGNDSETSGSDPEMSGNTSDDETQNKRREARQYLAVRAHFKQS